MVLAIPLIILGLVVLYAVHQWAQGQWVDSAKWVIRRVSPHALVGMRAAGIMLLGLGLMLLWPPAFLLAFGAAVGWIWVMASSAQTGAAQKLPRALREQLAPAPASAASPGDRPRRERPPRAPSEGGRSTLARLQESGGTERRAPGRSASTPPGSVPEAGRRQADRPRGQRRAG